GATFTLTTNNFSCTLAQIDAGIANDHTFTVTGSAATITGANTSGSISVSGTIGGTYNDPVPGNNTGTGTITIRPAADLATTVSGTATVNSGSAVPYTVSVASLSGNALPSGAAQVAITITPTNANYATVTITPANGDDCGAGANTAQTVTVGT